MLIHILNEKLGVMFEGGLGKKGKPLITIDSICFPTKTQYKFMQNHFNKTCLF